jgi:hypothetical protein
MVNSVKSRNELHDTEVLLILLGNALSVNRFIYATVRFIISCTVCDVCINTILHSERKGPIGRSRNMRKEIVEMDLT